MKTSKLRKSEYLTIRHNLTLLGVTRNPCVFGFGPTQTHTFIQLVTRAWLSNLLYTQSEALKLSLKFLNLTSPFLCFLSQLATVIHSCKRSPHVSNTVFKSVRPAVRPSSPKNRKRVDQTLCQSCGVKKNVCE